MSADDLKEQFIYSLPPSLLWEFCRVMDGLSDLDWTCFAVEVLGDQTEVRLAERRERRTDWVMNHWGNRNGRVGELINLLERLQLLRPRDVILRYQSSLKSTSSPPAPHSPPVSHLPFDPPSKFLSTTSTCTLSTTDEGGGGPLPRPAPPPSSLQSNPPRLFQPPLVTEPSSSPVAAGVMRWSIEEVQSGTEGFSPALQVGEGGFGVVYRATLRNTDCAVKRLKQFVKCKILPHLHGACEQREPEPFRPPQVLDSVESGYKKDCLLDWTLVRQSFKNEVDKLSKFRHPNIVDLLGFSEGEGSVCLIYSYMENRSVEDQLHNERGRLSWTQRLAVVDGTATALQFLHSPPDGHSPLIHGDVKSSNILLDQHLVPKLADFGLARLVCGGSSGRSAAQTVSVGKSSTVRGTLAYLPDEYVRNGELSTALDVYSFGVVLLEILTGRRALEKDRKSRERFLKDLVEEVEDTPTGSLAAAWRKQLDHRLIPGQAADPAGYVEVAALACRCLDKKRKKRPAMTEVFEILQNIHSMARKTNCSRLPVPPATHCFPRAPSSVDSSVTGLSKQLSRLGPLEGTYVSSQSFSCALTPPHPLHSSSSLPTSSTTSSLAGPCESDESQGFSQYNISCEFKSIRDQYGCPTESQFSPPSVPTEDQDGYDRPVAEEMLGTAREAGLPARPSSVPGAPTQPVHMNLLETQDKDRWIQSAKQLSSADLYEGNRGEESRGPEESDELDYIPA